MNIHGRYSYDELEAIMDETDLLICPSVWYETFGYTVLEALSFGVPVLVSDTVGAKDIIPDDWKNFHRQGGSEKHYQIPEDE